MTMERALERGRKGAFEVGGGLAAVLDDWAFDAAMRRCVVLDEKQPPKAPTWAPVPDTLAPAVVRALAMRTITRLYSHQARSFELAKAGRDFVVATPTASGKSLCFHLPVLDRLAREKESRALYLFPTKALSRDQEQSLHQFLRDAELEHGAITYDGDTPGDARRAARERAGVLITNPDMLHAGILPHHASWARFFANLRYVVIDELHAYRGVFGSHLANVIRRLLRVARFHGSSPQFVFASATIGNPAEHASRMLGRDVDAIDETGAPTGARQIIVYNPPIVNAELGIRASYLKTAVRLSSDLVRAGVPTLVFGQSRNGVETMLKYLRDRLIRDKLDPDIIHGYRGGYLPETRRRIEAGLRDGQIRCVVATNALELGIDIGTLDAVVCAGYPGTVAGLWQRFGRGGRRGGLSLSVLVTSSAPLDQFMAADPRFLVGAPIEQARIDPDNVEILIQHMKCAAFELPFDEGDAFGDVPKEAVGDALGYLAQHRLVHPVTGKEGRRIYHWSSDSYPANDVSLRSVGWDNFVIVDVEESKTIGEMDWRSAHTMLHEQAIYQHEGEQFQVEKLDFENHKAFVRKVAPDYYTDAMTHVKITVISEDESTGNAAGSTLGCGLGDVSVFEKVVGYKKIKFHSHENVGYGDVHLPEMQMHTTAFWVTFPEDVVSAQPVERPVVIDALRGVANAMHTIAAAGLMIDPHDLGWTIGDRTAPDALPAKDRGAGAGFDPTVFLFDHVAGGIGLAPRLFDEREDLLRRTRRLIQSCVCEHGCPACIGPQIVASATGAPISRKALAVAILQAVGIEGTH